jgi:hypothetical protein
VTMDDVYATHLKGPSQLLIHLVCSLSSGNGPGGSAGGS